MAAVRVGLFLAYWPWFSFEEQVRLATLADREGLDSVWVSEAWGQDAATVLGHLSAVTERIGLGSGLFQIPARTPAMTAMTAATLGAIGPSSVEQAARIADGWLPFFFHPQSADELLAPFRASGRDVEVAPVVLVCVDDDVAAARDMARPWLAIYLGGMGAKGKNFY